MAPRPTAERPPSGLNAYYTHVWNHALKVLKAQGTWEWEQKPLLDEYVFALRAAEQTREGFAWLDHLTDAVASEEIDWLTLKQIAGALPAQWDRHVKRAAALADKLILTPEAKRRHAIGDDADPPADPFGQFDEVAQARAKRAG